VKVVQFCGGYGMRMRDGTTDLPLDAMVARFRTSGAAAALLAVPPQPAFHCVELGPDDSVTGISALRDLPLWENGGYFVLRPEIFDHLPPGADLIGDACPALAKEGRLLAYPYHGWWQPADTAKERHALELAYHAGARPWVLSDAEPVLEAAAPGWSPLVAEPVLQR